jgi:hypothetical protein
MTPACFCDKTLDAKIESGGVGWGEAEAQTMYAHVSKCKIDKIKFKKRAR